MNKKKNNKQKQATPKGGGKSNTKKKPTPFADVGGIVGSRVGSMFNAPYLKGVGKWLGTGIGSIFGSGDYDMIGSPTKYNVLMNGAQVPQFSSNRATNIVCHREYLGDMSGTTAFTNIAFPINPGVATTFPWLSTIAQNYQEYKIHGLIFEFRSLITDFVPGGSPGVVVMATNYNSDSATFLTKQEMENSEFAVSVKPTLSLIHGVECATDQTVLPQLYVRSGAPATGVDLKTTDLGKFQFASQNNPTPIVLGELWISYCIEFFKPILPADVGPGTASARIDRSGYNNANPLGTANVRSSGDLLTDFTSTVLTVAGQPGNYYLVDVIWNGTAAAITAYPAVTFALCTPVLYFNNNTSSTSTNPIAATNSNTQNYQAVVRADHAAGGSFQLIFGAGVLGAGTFVTIIVTQVSSESI
jgi:hypothetical protein